MNWERFFGDVGECLERHWIDALDLERLHEAFVAPQRRQIHVRLLFDPRYRWLLDVQRGRDVGLRLAGELA